MASGLPCFTCGERSLLPAASSDRLDHAKNPIAESSDECEAHDGLADAAGLGRLLDRLDRWLGRDNDDRLERRFR
jgi:hypothetical protein